MNLTTRIEKLEQAAENNEHGMVISWTLTEDTQLLHCAGQNFTRQEGESLSDFTDRAVASVNTVPGKILWMDGSAA